LLNSLTILPLSSPEADSEIFVVDGLPGADRAVRPGAAAQQHTGEHRRALVQDPLHYFLLVFKRWFEWLLEDANTARSRQEHWHHP